jgi:hypothetical protein
MSEPLTLDAMLASIGWRLDYHGNGDVCATDVHSGALRISDRWGPDWTRAAIFACGSRGPEGAWLTFDEAVAAAYRHHVLGEREAVDPGDSTGARCAVYAVEAGPVEDCDEGDPLVAAFIRWRDADDPRPLWEYVGTDEAGLDARIRRRMTDIDGTPDTLPAVDACAS